MVDSDVTKFLVSFEGSVETVQFEGGIEDAELYLRYWVVTGEDWSVVSGLTGAVSQLVGAGCDAKLAVFNLPLNITYSTTNVCGWPQLVVSVYGVTSRGREGLRGYGRVYLPTTAATNTVSLRLFRPQSLTRLGAFLAWLTGRTPEIAEPVLLAKPDIQYLMRTESYGVINVKVSMVSKDMHRLGYDNQPGQTFRL